MTIDEFLQQLSDALEVEEKLVAGQALADVDNWDSLGILSVVSLLEEMGVKIDIDSVSAASTTDDLIAIARPAIEG